MDSRDLWEDQVERLTKKYKTLYDNIEMNNERILYLENVVLTLLKALKANGIITDAREDNNRTYEF